MAGNDPTGAFNSTAFQAGIHLAMTMGMPNIGSEQPIFRWVTVPSYSTANPVDPSGRPYSWADTPSVTNAVSDFQGPLVAVEYGASPDQGTILGEEQLTAAHITMLGPDQALLIAHGGRMPDQVVLGGVIYSIEHMTLQALFTVDVYDIYLQAVDAV